MNYYRQRYAIAPVRGLFQANEQGKERVFLGKLPALKYQYGQTLPRGHNHHGNPVRDEISALRAQTDCPPFCRLWHFEQ